MSSIWCVFYAFAFFLIPTSFASTPLGIAEQRINGYRVIFVDTKSDHECYFEAFVGAGGAADWNFKPGTAHFVEHLVASGSTRFPAESKPYSKLEEMGETNAETSETDTAYYWSGTIDYLSEAVEIYANLVTDPEFNEEVIEVEREAILDETATALHSDSQFLTSNAEKYLLFGKSPMSLNILGSKSSIKSITRTDLQRFWASHYRADTITVVVAAPFKGNPALRRDVAEALSKGLVEPKPPTTFTETPPTSWQRSNYATTIHSTKFIHDQLAIYFPLHNHSTEQLRVINAALRNIDQRIEGGFLYKLQNQNLVNDISYGTTQFGELSFAMIAVDLGPKADDSDKITMIAQDILGALNSVAAGDYPGELLALDHLYAEAQVSKFTQSPLLQSLAVRGALQANESVALHLERERHPSMIPRTEVISAVRSLDADSMRVLLFRSQDTKLKHRIPDLPSLSYQDDESIDLRKLRKFYASGETSRIYEPGYKWPQRLPQSRHIGDGKLGRRSVSNNIQELQGVGTLLSLSSSYDGNAGLDVLIEAPASSFDEIFALDLLVECWMAERSIHFFSWSSQLEHLSILSSQYEDRLSIRIKSEGASDASHAIAPIFIDDLKKFQPTEAMLERAYQNVERIYAESRDGHAASVAAEDLEQILTPAHKHLFDRQHLAQSRNVDLKKIHDVQRRLLSEADLIISAAGRTSEELLKKIGKDIRELIPREMPDDERSKLREPKALPFRGDRYFVRTPIAKSSSVREKTIGLARAFIYEPSLAERTYVSLAGRLIGQLVSEENRHLGYQHDAAILRFHDSRSIALEIFGQTTRISRAHLIVDGWANVMKSLVNPSNELTQLVQSYLDDETSRAGSIGTDWGYLARYGLDIFRKNRMTTKDWMAYRLKTLKNVEVEQVTELAIRLMSQPPSLTVAAGPTIDRIPTKVMNDCQHIFHEVTQLTELIQKKL